MFVVGTLDAKNLNKNNVKMLIVGTSDANNKKTKMYKHVSGWHPGRQTKKNTLQKC